MKIELLRIWLPLVVGAVVPLFFIAVYVGSSVRRLAQLRLDCDRALICLVERSRDCERAASAFLQAVRSRFPSGDAESEQVGAARDALTGLLATFPARIGRTEKDDPAPALGIAVEHLAVAVAGLETKCRSEGAEVGGRPQDFGKSRDAFLAARQAYDEAVAADATFCQRFPGNVLGRCCGRGGPSGFRA